mgnify:CR=1 FL=1
MDIHYPSFRNHKEYIQSWTRGNKTTEAVLKDITKETSTEYGLVLEETFDFKGSFGEINLPGIRQQISRRYMNLQDNIYCDLLR